jgi:BASS family bile acid:Na+ symporter
MMDTDTLITIVLVIGIVLLVLDIGLGSRLDDPLHLLRRPSLGLRGMLAMFVVMPLFTLLLVRLFPLQAGVGAALLGFSVSPMLPPWGKTGTAVGGQRDYVFGLQVLATAVAILVVPVMLWLVALVFKVEGQFDSFAFSMILLVTVGIPLALGVAIARYLPDLARWIGGKAARVGQVVLLLGAVALLVTSYSTILGVLGNGTLLAAVVIVCVSLLVGHLLGGPDAGNRGALATATACRHPGIALLLAVGVVADFERAILGTVLVYLIASLVISALYQRWHRSPSGPGGRGA